MSLDKLAQMMQGFDLNGLQKMVDNMQSIQKQHVTVGGVTFDKTELKRAEPTKQNDTNCTRLIWKDGTDTILDVSKFQFDKEFNK